MFECLLEKLRRLATNLIKAWVNYKQGDVDEMMREAIEFVKGLSQLHVCIERVERVTVVE